MSGLDDIQNILDSVYNSNAAIREHQREVAKYLRRLDEIMCVRRREERENTRDICGADLLDREAEVGGSDDDPESAKVSDDEVDDRAGKVEVGMQSFLDANKAQDAEVTEVKVIRKAEPRRRRYAVKSLGPSKKIKKN